MSLDEYKSGSGGMYFPDPDSSMSCQDLLTIKGKITFNRNDIQNRLGDFKKSSSTDPMKELIRLMNVKIQKYTDAIAACTGSQPIGAGSSDTPSTATGLPGGVVDETGTNSVGTNAANSGGAGMPESSSKKKIFIIGGILLVVLIGAALYIRHRKASKM